MQYLLAILFIVSFELQTFEQLSLKKSQREKKCISIVVKYSVCKYESILGIEEFETSSLNTLYHYIHDLNEQSQSITITDYWSGNDNSFIREDLLPFGIDLPPPFVS